MKKLFILFIALAALMVSVYASNTQVDGIWYNFDSNALTAEVTYRGSKYDSYSNEYTGVVVIPSSVLYNNKTYRVTSIGKTAFYDCSSMTSITIPNSIKSIDTYAFTRCTGLTSVEIPNSVTSIGYWAFGICTSLTSIEIPNGVTSIGANTFNGCTGMTSITIPNSVTSIGAGAFLDCIGLTAILIPNSVKSIGEKAFAGCSNLTSITIPNNDTEYGNNVFKGCISLPIIGNIRYADTYLVGAVNKTLSTYTIRQNTTWIGDSAFATCDKLTSIRIPDNIKGIGRGPFASCDKLPVINNIRYADTYAIEGQGNRTTYTIKEGTIWIGERAFKNEYNVNNHSNLVSIDIPNGVKNIGECAFYRCSSLRSVTIPNSVTSIGDHAFDDCEGLTSVEIPDGVTYIGKWAFNSCNGLRSVEIPSSVKIIDDNAFFQCYYLDSVVIGANVKSIGTEAFAICSSLKSFVVKPTTPPALHGNTFADSGSKYSIYVPCGTVDTYKNANKWKSYASKIKNMPSPFHVSTISENGKVSVPKYSICDDSIKIVAIPDEGYCFVQWSDGNKDNPRYITLTQDTTFIAEFAKNMYLVQFFGFNDVLLNSQSVEHGAAATAPKAPTIDHYDFVGWDKDFTNITSNLDVFAIYQQNTEDVENVNMNTLPQKVVIDDHIYILRGEHVYDTEGKIIK